MDATLTIVLVVMVLALSCVVVLAFLYAGGQRRRRLRAEKERVNQSELIAKLTSDLKNKNEELEKHMHLSMKDPLTGVGNRRTFEEELARESDRAARFDHDLAVLFVDVDNLKTVNDVLEHCEGDARLVMIAEILQGQSRTADVVCRVGGDEFALILPETDPHGAEQKAEYIVEAVRNAYRSHQFPSTVSVGIATYKADGSEDLVSLADTRMYKAKKAGGDRYCCL